MSGSGLVEQRLRLVRHHARVAAWLDRAAAREEAAMTAPGGDPGRTPAAGDESLDRSRMARSRAGERRRRALSVLAAIREGER